MPAQITAQKPPFIPSQQHGAMRCDEKPAVPQGMCVLRLRLLRMEKRVTLAF
jgi:hypothetical protein